jgi:hypothetical protein
MANRRLRCFSATFVELDENGRKRVFRGYVRDVAGVSFLGVVDVLLFDFHSPFHGAEKLRGCSNEKSRVSLIVFLEYPFPAADVHLCIDNLLLTFGVDRDGRGGDASLPFNNLTISRLMLQQCPESCWQLSPLARRLPWVPLLVLPLVSGGKTAHVRGVPESFFHAVGINFSHD